MQRSQVHLKPHCASRRGRRDEEGRLYAVSVVGLVNMWTGGEDNWSPGNMEGRKTNS